MTHDVGFVAGVLEGCEGTIVELMAVTRGDLKLSVGLDSLKSQIESLRLSLESSKAGPVGASNEVQ